VCQVALLTTMIIVGGFASPVDNPMLGPSAIMLATLGGNNKNYVLNDGEWWRLFTAIFSHAGIIHLLSNLFVQIKVGFELERVWGPYRMFGLYIISGLCGNITSTLFMNQYTVSVGASGALLGLYGAIVTDNLKNWNVMKHAKKQLYFWLLVLFIFFIFGFIPFVDNFVHTSGLLSGFLLGTIFVPNIQKRPIRQKILIVMSATCTLIIWKFIELYTLYVHRDFRCVWCCYIVGKFNC